MFLFKVHFDIGETVYVASPRNSLDNARQLAVESINLSIKDSFTVDINSVWGVDAVHCKSVDVEYSLLTRASKSYAEIEEHHAPQTQP